MRISSRSAPAGSVAKEFVDIHQQLLVVGPALHFGCFVLDKMLFCS